MKPISARRWALLLAICGSFLVFGCSSLLLYYPSSKYDNKVVRGVVTHIATKEEMGENWDRKHVGVAELPPRNIYINQYKRVVVTVERGIGSGFFVYPFVPDEFIVSVGDLVDVPLTTGDGKSFDTRLQVLKIVCKADDQICLRSSQGRVRGAVGDVSRSP